MGIIAIPAGPFNTVINAAFTVAADVVYSPICAGCLARTWLPWYMHHCFLAIPVKRLLPAAVCTNMMPEPPSVTTSETGTG